MPALVITATGRRHRAHDPVAGAVLGRLLTGPGHQEDRVVDAEGHQEQEREQRRGVVEGREAEHVHADPAAEPERGERAEHRDRHQHQRCQRRPQQHVEHDQHHREDRGDHHARSRSAAARASRAAASDPPTERVRDRRRAPNPEAHQRFRRPSSEPGSAFSTTDHWVVSAGECPVSRGRYHAGGGGDRALDLRGTVGGRDHPRRVGQPAGEVRGERVVPVDGFGLNPELFGLRQADRRAEQAGAQQQRVRRSRRTATPAGRRATPAAMRCQTPAVGQRCRRRPSGRTARTAACRTARAAVAAPAARRPRPPPGRRRPARRGCGCSATTRAAG